MEEIWYLWPKDDSPTANEYLVTIIGEQDAAEYQHARKKCADGVSRNLFECPRGYRDIRTAIAALQKFDLQFEVFRAVDNNKPGRFDLWKQSARKKARVARQREKGRKITP